MQAETAEMPDEYPSSHDARVALDDPQISHAADLVREYLRDQAIPPNGRLPPEKDMAAKLGITRGRLRQAFEVMSRAGEIWRHVGKGTFVGPVNRPTSLPLNPLAIEDHSILERTNPLEVLEARLTIEPKLAAMAAVRGTPGDFRRLHQLLSQEENAVDGIAAQEAGSMLHRVISTSARNELLDWLFEKVFAIRQATSWGKMLPTHLGPEQIATNLREHRAIVEAISMRDARRAENLMREHLENLKRAILASTEP